MQVSGRAVLRGAVTVDHQFQAVYLPQPYLLFLGEVVEPGFAKTALGLRDWAPDQCVGEHSLVGANVSTGMKRLGPAKAVAAGARSMVIGDANSGGFIPSNWTASLIEALEAWLDLVAGMHSRLSDVPALADAAACLGRRLIDVRVPPANIPVGNGRKRTGKRLLTVGTDCALGKNYTAMALARAIRGRGIEADFPATGPTGIMIAGGGIPMDAVVSDFEAGAAEMLSPDAAPGHWDVIEGQGSLFRPAYAAVSLGLLHGSQPDVFVVCDEPGRTEMLGAPGYQLPSIAEVIELTLLLGRRTNAAIRCGGIAYNSSHLDFDDATRVMAADAERLGLPVADPIRGGAALDRLVDSYLG